MFISLYRALLIKEVNITQIWPRPSSQYLLSSTSIFVSLPLLFQTLIHKDLCSYLLLMVSKVNNLYYSLNKYTLLEYLNDAKYLLIFMSLACQTVTPCFYGFRQQTPYDFTSCEPLSHRWAWLMGFDGGQRHPHLATDMPLIV